MRRPLDVTVLTIGLLLACAGCQSATNSQDDGGLALRGSRPTETSASTETTMSQAEDRTVFTIEVGDCISDILQPDGSTVMAVSVVPCAQAHQVQLYAKYDVELTEYPGDDAMFEAAGEGCNARVPPSLAADWGATGQYAPLVLNPTRESWALDDREVLCLVMRIDEKDITGTLL